MIGSPISSTATLASLPSAINVATEAVCPEGECSLVRTQWIPEAEVER